MLDRQPVAPGDVARTGGTIERAVDLLGWKPATDVTDGLRAEIDWMRVILG